MKIVKRGQKSIRKKIFAIMDDIIGEEYDCADNFRIAEVGNVEAEALYQNIYDGGCCGYYDSTIEFEGKTYKIGFNYGH